MTLSDLKKVAEAATPGPWWAEGLEIESSHVIIGSTASILADRDATEAQAIADFIATFNPEMVLKLLEANEAIATRIQELTRVILRKDPTFDLRRLEWTNAQNNAQMTQKKLGGGLDAP